MIHIPITYNHRFVEVISDYVTVQLIRPVMDLGPVYTASLTHYPMALTLFPSRYISDSLLTLKYAQYCRRCCIPDANTYRPHYPVLIRQKGKVHSH